MVQVAWAGSQWDLQGVGRVSAAESRLGDMPPSPLHSAVPRQDEGDMCQGPKHTLTWATYPLPEVTAMGTLRFGPSHPTIQVRVIPLNSGWEAGQSQPVDFTPKVEGELEEEASRCSVCVCVRAHRCLPTTV